MTEYSSLDELKANEAENVDWRKSFQQRHSWLVVVAPHGNQIEPKTEIIAAEIAGQEHSLFVFEGLRGSEPNRKSLHVRSERYIDADLQHLQNGALVTISIHGAKNREEGPSELTHIGGRNAQLGKLIWKALEGADFEVVGGIGHLAGQDPNNFVNRTAAAGVQFEISRALRQRLADEPEQLAKYTAAIRSALTEYRRIIPSKP
jgi:phage replication-related protein YjqB (UPF0714/DUF867 family)